MTSLHSVVPYTTLICHKCHVNVVTLAAQLLRACLKIPNLNSTGDDAHEAEHCEL